MVITTRRATQNSVNEVPAPSAADPEEHRDGVRDKPPVQDNLPALRKSTRLPGPVPAEEQLVDLKKVVLPSKTRKRRTKDEIEADKAAKAAAKAAKAAAKAAKTASGFNRIAALHMPVNGTIRTPRPSAEVFQAREARRSSQAGSLFVVEGESPMVPDGFKQLDTYSDDETQNPTPYKRSKTTNVPSMDPNPDANNFPGFPDPTSNVGGVEGLGDVDGDLDQSVADDSMQIEGMDELREEAREIAARKLQELEAKAVKDAAKAVKDAAKAEKDAAKAIKMAERVEKDVAKAIKKAEKAKRDVARAEEKETKEAAKAKKEAAKAEKEAAKAEEAKAKAEKDAVKTKGKGKTKTGPTDAPATAGVPKTITTNKRSNKSKKDSGARDGIAAAYHKQQSAAAPAATDSSKDAQDVLTTGESGGKEVGKGKRRAATDGSVVSIADTAEDVAMNVEDGQSMANQKAARDRKKVTKTSTQRQESEDLPAMYVSFSHSSCSSLCPC